jgi:mercuric ion binding protein
MLRKAFQTALIVLVAGTALPALAADAVRTIRMEVAGLVCGFCAQGIDKQMRTFDATRDVWIDLARGVVAVELAPGEDIADDVLDKALTDAGYTLTAIRRVDRPLAEVRREVEDAPRR